MIMTLGTIEHISFPSQKIGKRWRFHRDAVDEWVKHGLEPKQTGADE